MGHRLGEPLWCSCQGSLGSQRMEGSSCSPRQDASPVGVVLHGRQMQGQQCFCLHGCAAWVFCLLSVAPSVTCTICCFTEQMDLLAGGLEVTCNSLTVSLVDRCSVRAKPYSFQPVLNLDSPASKVVGQHAWGRMSNRRTLVLC